MESTKTYTSPAKVNLTLHMTGRREDGYHYLDSLMTKVSLHDDITISMKEGDGITLRCPGNPALEGEGNLAFKAAKLLLEELGEKRDIDMEITKRIPIEGGLGGGSSNAATVLKGINEIGGFDLSSKQLSDIGKQIGSDVPFFIYDGSARVTGVGDRVEPIKGMPHLEMIITTPSFGISTKKVYEMLPTSLTKSVFDGKNEAFLLGSEVDFESVCNDLEPYALKIKPDLALLKKMLLENGAKAAIVSGSGSSVFGVFADMKAADGAQQIIKEECPKLENKTGKIRVFRVTTVD